MIRQAVAQDAKAIEEFLFPHAATSMFLRGNLASYGVENDTAPNATNYYLWEQDGQIRAVVGRSNGGYLMCQVPGAGPEVWSAFARALTGRKVVGMTGAPDQIDAFAAALDWDTADLHLCRIEPLYALNLSAFANVSDAGLLLRRPATTDTLTLADWFKGYNRDTGLGAPDTTAAEALAKRFVLSPDARVLTCNGILSAMTGLNARTYDTVQIGGVYVPPQLRGRGFGGTIVALHLMQLRAEGVLQAILFAANTHAAKAYERIGFVRIGSYKIALLKTPKIAEEIA